jgi:hypothetical protein
MYCSHHVLLVSNIVVRFDLIFDFTHTFWNVATFCPFILEKIPSLSMFRHVEKSLVYQKVFNVSIDH